MNGNEEKKEERDGEVDDDKNRRSRRKMRSDEGSERGGRVRVSWATVGSCSMPPPPWPPPLGLADARLVDPQCSAATVTAAAGAHHQSVRPRYDEHQQLHHTASAKERQQSAEAAEPSAAVWAGSELVQAAASRARR